MQEAPAGVEQRLGMLALAIGRVEVEGRRRRRRAPGPLVAHHHPQSAGLGPAPSRRQHRHRRVVGVQRGAGADMPADRLDQGLEQERHPADPVGQHRAIDLDPGPGIDVALPVQRQVIAVLRHQHMGEQARTRPAPLDRQRRHRRLHDRLASAAAQLRPDVAPPLEERGHVFEHLALVLADPAEHRAAAARAGAGRRVHHVLARQMVGQRLAGPASAGALPRGWAGSTVASSAPRSRPGLPRARRSAARVVRCCGRASPRTGRTAPGAAPPAASSASRCAASWRESRSRCRERQSRSPAACSITAKARNSSGSEGREAIASDMPQHSRTSTGAPE